MKNLLNLTITCLLMLSISGCSTLAPNTAALSKDATSKEKAAAALADVKKNLEDPTVQKAAKISLPIAWGVGMSTVKDQSDIDAIMAQRKAWGQAGQALLNSGQTVTADQFKGIFTTFDSSLDATKFAATYGPITSQAGNIFDALKGIDDVQLLRTWAQIFVDADLAGVQ